MEEVKEQGADVHLVHIREKQIRFCQACYGCAAAGCGSDCGTGGQQEAEVSEKPGQVTGRKNARRMQKNV